MIGEYRVVKGSPVEHVREFLNRLEVSKGMVCSNRLLWGGSPKVVETRAQRVARLRKSRW
jgi:hypothetical protein